MTNGRKDGHLGSEWFWSIIAIAGADRDALQGQLLKLSQEDLRRFQEEFIVLASELQVSPFAAFVEESEDGLADVAEWVVSQGKNMYQAVVADPASIPHTVEGKGGEILSGVAPLVYEERFGEPLHI